MGEKQVHIKFGEQAFAFRSEQIVTSIWELNLAHMHSFSDFKYQIGILGVIRIQSRSRILLDLEGSFRIVLL